MNQAGLPLVCGRKVINIFCRKVLKIKIIIVYLQPAKMYCGA